MNYVQALKHVVPQTLWPYLGALRRFVRSAPPRTWLQKQRLLSDSSLSKSDRKLLGEVSSRIYYNDGMYHGNGAQYYKVGLSAIHCIDEAVEHAGLKAVHTILDLPCGGGRVLRFLVRRFPEAKSTACDLQQDAVDSCAEEFGATRAYSSPDFDTLTLGACYDLTWCGSLITHLNVSGISSLLRFFARHLEPHGLLVFTSHGERAIQRMRSRELDYGIAPDEIQALIADYRERGFGFASYPKEDDYGVPANEGQYGISLAAPSWIRALAEPMGLIEVYFRAQGWDDHQDVYGFVKRA